MHLLLVLAYFVTGGRYVRALGAFYMRLVGRPVDVYQYLEPLYNDYRKLKLLTPTGLGSFSDRRTFLLE